MTIDNLLNFWHATVTHLKGVLGKIFHNLCPVGKHLPIRVRNAPPIFLLRFFVEGRVKPYYVPRTFGKNDFLSL